MTVDWSDAIRQLSQVRIFDCFRNRSMPEFVEPLVTKLVRSFSTTPEDGQRRLLSGIPAGVSWVFGWYARKLAGRAVRDRSRADLWNGVVALAICASKGDPRDAMAPLALLYNSALHLKENPRALIEEASKSSTQSVRDFFQGFLGRPPEQRSIAAFGFSEGQGPYGFDYVPLLPEYGGPTPF